MSIEDIVTIVKEAIYIIIKVSAPPLMISLIVGLAVSIFQTVTSIQEQTLTFVPKIVCTFIGIMVFGHWMLGSMVDFMVSLWTDFSIFVG